MGTRGAGRFDRTRRRAVLVVTLDAGHRIDSRAADRFLVRPRERPADTPATIAERHDVPVG